MADQFRGQGRANGRTDSSAIEKRRPGFAGDENCQPRGGRSHRCPSATCSKKANQMNYRTIDPNFAVAGQIQPDQIEALAAAGFKTIVCARPDNEEPGQPSFRQIQAQADKLGIKAVHIPISGGVSDSSVTQGPAQADVRLLPLRRPRRLALRRRPAVLSRVDVSKDQIRSSYSACRQDRRPVLRDRADHPRPDRGDFRGGLPVDRVRPSRQ